MKIITVIKQLAACVLESPAQFNNIRLDCKMNVSVQNIDIRMLPGNNHLFPSGKRIFTGKKTTVI